MLGGWGDLGWAVGEAGSAEEAAGLVVGRLAGATEPGVRVAASVARAMDRVKARVRVGC